MGASGEDHPDRTVAHGECNGERFDGDLNPISDNVCVYFSAWRYEIARISLPSQI